MASCQKADPSVAVTKAPGPSMLTAPAGSTQSKAQTRGIKQKGSTANQTDKDFSAKDSDAGDSDAAGSDTGDNARNPSENPTKTAANSGTGGTGTTQTSGSGTTTPGTTGVGTTTSTAKQAPKVNFLDDATAAPKISQAEALLGQYPSGKIDLSDMNSTGIIVKLASKADISKVADIGGGTSMLEGNGATGGATSGATPGASNVASIILNGDAAPEDIAQGIAYEAQKLSDKLAQRQYFTAQSQIYSQIQTALKKFKDLASGAGTETLTDQDKSALLFHTSGLFCLEVRALNKNVTLVREGLQTSVDTFKTTNLGPWVDQNVITARGFPSLLPSGDLTSLANQCLAQKSISDFQTLIVPQSNLVANPGANPSAH